jgi:type II secretory pathway component PulK
VFSGLQLVDSIPVTVQAVDLGTKLNVNAMEEIDFRTLFAYVLGDYVQADALAQSIVDWRDQDDISRTKGAERDDYVKAGLLRLPTNQPFRDIEELLDVKGMTPEIFGLVSPYLTTYGGGQVNLNSAPVPVLRVLPGMTDEIVANILNLRSRGSRITSVSEVLPQVRGGASQGVRGAQQQQNQNTQQQLTARATVLTQQLELTLIAQASPAARPVRLRVYVARASTNGQQIAGVLGEDWR